MLQVGNIINHSIFRKAKMCVVTKINGIQNDDLQIIYKGECVSLGNKFTINKSISKKPQRFVLIEYKPSENKIGDKPYRTIEEYKQGILNLEQLINKTIKK